MGNFPNLCDQTFASLLKLNVNSQINVRFLSCFLSPCVRFFNVRFEKSTPLVAGMIFKRLCTSTFLCLSPIEWGSNIRASCFQFSIFYHRVFRKSIKIRTFSEKHILVIGPSLFWPQENKKKQLSCTPASFRCNLIDFTPPSFRTGSKVILLINGVGV